MRAKQQLGQNFLMHAATARRIVTSSKVPPGSHVLEIGPGTGMLTRELLDAGLFVTAIETDTELIPQLEKLFSVEIATGTLILIHGDIRTFDLSKLPNPYCVIANIPYYITGEIIRTLLTATHKPSSMTLLVQKEVAVRVARSEKESLLSLSVKAYGTPSIAFLVPRGAFRPAPKVDSAVLHIASIHSVFRDSEHETFFFEVLHAGFGQKRKRLAKNLELLSTREHIADEFASLSVSPNTRSEDVVLSTWLALAESLYRAQ